MLPRGSARTRGARLPDPLPRFPGRNTHFPGSASRNRTHLAGFGVEPLWVYCPGDEAECPGPSRAARRVSARRAPALRRRLHPAPRRLARVVVLRGGRARPRRADRGRVIAGSRAFASSRMTGRLPSPRRVAHASALARDARAHPGPGLRGTVGRARAHGGSADRARRAGRRRAGAARCVGALPPRGAARGGRDLDLGQCRARRRRGRVAGRAALAGHRRRGDRGMGLRGMARRRAMARRALARRARRDERDTVRAGPRGRRRPARGVGARGEPVRLSLSRRQFLGDDGPGARRGRRPCADGLRRGASRDGAVRRPAPRALGGWRARHRAGVDPCARAVRHAARRRSARGRDGATPALRAGQARAGRAGVGPGVVRVAAHRWLATARALPHAGGRVAWACFAGARRGQ